MNDLSVAAALATSPSSTFAELRERPRFWLPLVVIVITSMIMIGWYYSVVDIDWLKEQMYGNDPNIQKMAPEQRAQAMAFVGRNTIRFGSLFAVLVFVPTVFLITALYFFIAAKITKVELGYKHWLTLVTWSALPGLINTIAAVVFLLLRDNDQITDGILQPLSLNELVFHIPPGAKGRAFFEALNISGVLSWILSIMGVRVFAQRSWLYSSIVALVPVVVTYAVVAFFSFR